MVTRRRSRWRIVFSLMLAGTHAGPVAAQQRPLPIETVDGAGAGNITIEAGVDYTRDAQFTLSGLGGNLWRVGLVRIDVGLSSIADVELSGGLRDHLEITSARPAVLSDRLQLINPASTGAFDDIIVGTKIKVLGGQAGTPGLALHVATRLPNAKHASGLGQDTTDFYARLIGGQSISTMHVTGNVGFGILADPIRGNRHVESFLYGAAISRPVASQASVHAGVDGRTGPNEPGLEPRAISRIGMRWTRGPARVDLDGTLGLTSRDGNVGLALSAGVTFHAFAP